MRQLEKWTAFAAVLSALVWQGSASAQNVTIYGILDTGVEYVSHASSAGSGVVRMPSTTGELPSRWGLTGSESLGNGYKAIFTLESGLALGSGTLNQGGRMFGRQAFVGIDGPLGTLTFGRQYSMMLWSLLSSDFIGPSIYALGSLDAWIANARSDNTVAYRLAHNGLSVGASYSFGRDASPTGGTNSPGQGTCAGQIVGNAAACREWSLLARYDAANWGATASYDRQQGGPGAMANMFNGLAPLALGQSGDSDTRLLLSAYGKARGWTLSALWLNRRVDATTAPTPGVTSNTYVIEAAYQLSPSWVVDGMVLRVIDRAQNTRATMEALRATYSLSVRTAVYAQVAALQNSANAAYSVSSGGPSTPPKGEGQVGAMLGMRHTF